MGTNPSRMKLSNFYFVLLTLLSLTSYAQKVKKNTSVSTFNKIEISGGFEIFLRKGNQSECILVGEQDDLKKVLVSVDDETLEIESEAGFWNPISSKIQVFITVSDIKSIELNGGCTLTAKNKISQKELEIELSGASSIGAEVDIFHLDFSASGASSARLEGVVKYIDADLSGSSKLDAENLESSKLNIECSGASHAIIRTSEFVKANLSGASSVINKSKAKDERIETSGASHYVSK